MKFSKTANIFFMAGIAVSLGAIILGLMIGANANNAVDYCRFGADFYTEIHAAVRTTCENIGYLIKGLGFLLDILGGFGLCFFGSLLCLERNDTTPTDMAISADSSISKTNVNEEQKTEETKVAVNDTEEQETPETNEEK